MKSVCGSWWESRGWRCCSPCSCSWYEYGSRDFAGRFGLDFSMAVVAVPFILYLVCFCTPKPCKQRHETRTSTAPLPHSDYVLHEHLFLTVYTRIQWPSGLAKFVIFCKTVLFYRTSGRDCRIAERCKSQKASRHEYEYSYATEYSTRTRMQHPGMMYVRVRVPAFARVPYCTEDYF